MKLVFPDTETTGLDRKSDEIIELAALRIDWETWTTEGVFYRRFKPTREVHPEAAKVNHYTPWAWESEPEIYAEALDEFVDFCDGARWVGSMPQFDFDMIERPRLALGVRNLALASRRLWCVNSLAAPLVIAGHVDGGGLDELCTLLDIEPKPTEAMHLLTRCRTGPHTAMGDALRTAALFRELMTAYLRHAVTPFNPMLVSS